MYFKALVEHSGSGQTDRRWVAVESRDIEEATKKVLGNNPGNSVVAIVALGEQKVIRVTEVNQRIPVETRPVRVWTLLKNDEPQLPVIAVHHENAFLEDSIHDWDWKDGILRYYSRVKDPPLWVLLQY